MKALVRKTDHPTNGHRAGDIVEFVKDDVQPSPRSWEAYEFIDISEKEMKRILSEYRGRQSVSSGNVVQKAPYIGKYDSSEKSFTLRENDNTLRESK